MRRPGTTRAPRRPSCTEKSFGHDSTSLDDAASCREASFPGAGGRQTPSRPQPKGTAMATVTNWRFDRARRHRRQPLHDAGHRRRERPALGFARSGSRRTATGGSSGCLIRGPALTQPRGPAPPRHRDLRLPGARGRGPGRVHGRGGRGAHRRALRAGHRRPSPATPRPREAAWGRWMIGRRGPGRGMGANGATAAPLPRHRLGALRARSGGRRGPPGAGVVPSRGASSGRRTPWVRTRSTRLPSAMFASTRCRPQVASGDGVELRRALAGRDLQNVGAAGGRAAGGVRARSLRPGGGRRGLGHAEDA